MPRYYFDLPQESDQLGSELPDIAAAQLLAKRYVGDLLRDGRDPAEAPCWRMDVRQGAGPVLFSLVLELVPALSARRVSSSPATRPQADEHYG